MSIWSSMNKGLEDAKSQLNDMKRNRKFAKSNRNREEKAELQYSLGKCRGKMEVCKKDFDRIIRNQSRYIQEGQQDGMDTLINEQNLWDAALGYMLVKDAIFALRTVADYDSITHAYEMLDAASRQISGKGVKKVQMPWKKTGTRNDYDYITADSAIKEKEELLDGFFEELKATGDIEACLKGRRRPGNVNAARRTMYTGKGTAAEKTSAGVGQPESTRSSLDDIAAQVSGVQDDEVEMDDYGDGMDNIMDIHPPKNI